MKRKNKGFTLIELVVVLAIITTLSLVAVGATKLYAVNQRKDSFKSEVYTFVRLLKVEDKVNGDFNITNGFLYEGNETTDPIERDTFIDLVLKLEPRLLNQDSGTRNFDFYNNYGAVEFIYKEGDYIYVATWQIADNTVDVYALTEGNSQYNYFKTKYQLED